MLSYLWLVCLVFWAYHMVQAVRHMPDELSGLHLAYMWVWWAIMIAFFYLL